MFKVATALLLSIGVLDSHAAWAQAVVPAESTQWISFSTEKGELSLQHPGGMEVRQDGTGQTCVNQVCQATERFALVGRDAATGQRKAFMNISIQRGQVTRPTPIETYFESQLRRPLDGTVDKITTLDGQRSIRQKGMVEVSSGKTNEKNEVVFTSKSMRPIDRVAVLLSGTDLLIITNNVPQTEFDPTFEKILASVKIAP